MSTDAINARETLFEMYPELEADGEMTIAKDDHDFWEFYKDYKDELREAKVYTFRPDGNDQWTCAAHPLDCEETTGDTVDTQPF